MQNHRNGDLENDACDIFPNCNGNQLLGGDCQKFQDTEEASERKLTECDFQLALTPGDVESTGIETKLVSKTPEWHLNSSIKSQFQDDSNEPDLSGSYSSGFYFDKRCSKPLTSTPCSRKKQVRFQLADDYCSMDDSGYDGSPTSEEVSPIVSRKRNLELLSCANQDSFEENLGGTNLDSSDLRFCLLSRFDESDSANESYSSSKSSSSLAPLATDDSKLPNVTSDGKEKTASGRISSVKCTRDHQFSTKNTETAHMPSIPSNAFHTSSAENSGALHVSHKNTEICRSSHENSATVSKSSRRLTSRHFPEKNDSGFVEELSDFFDASMNISDLNAATILYANSPEFSLARKVISAKEYNDRLEMMLQKFAPPCLDRLIGRKMGLDKVDFISELYARNITGVLSAILNYLSDDDLQSMSDVSVRWRETVKCISRARYKKHRRCQHPSNLTRQTDRENSFIERNEQRLVTVAPEPLLQIQSILEVKISAKRIPNRTECFWQEASKLKNHEILRKCPRCRYPSRVDTAQERAWCSDSKCLYDFCIKCLAPFHSLRPCVGAKHTQPCARQEIKICSTMSKRNLRRL